ANGHILTLTDGDNSINLWDADGTHITMLNGYTARELSDGRIVSWSADGTIRLWNSDGFPITYLAGHTGRIDTVQELSDGRIMSWSYADGTIRLWDSDGGTPIATIIGHPYPYTMLGVIELSDGRIVSWSVDSTIRLWDIPR
ncbi:MAG: hypothetical protein KJ043_20560, partial [Anaerolineae bacterium]|nr:hypothetical protein [Anaerolineae bacterium]